MIPFQVENACCSIAIALERETPGRPADAGVKIVENRSRTGRDMPTRGRGAGLGSAGLTEQQAHDAALVGSQSQPSAGGEVELAGMASYLGEGGGQCAAAKGFL